MRKGIGELGTYCRVEMEIARAGRAEAERLAEEELKRQITPVRVLRVFLAGSDEDWAERGLAKPTPGKQESTKKVLAIA